MSLFKKEPQYFLETVRNKGSRQTASRLSFAARDGELDQVAKSLDQGAVLPKNAVQLVLNDAIRNGQFKELVKMTDPKTPLNKDDFTKTDMQGSALGEAMKHDCLGDIVAYLGQKKPFVPEDFLNPDVHGNVAMFGASSEAILKLPNYLKEGASFSREDITKKTGTFYAQNRSVLGEAINSGTLMDIAKIMPKEELPLADDFLDVGAGSSASLLSVAMENGSLAQIPSVLKKGESFKARHFLAENEATKTSNLFIASSNSSLRDVKTVLGEEETEKLFSEKVVLDSMYNDVMPDGSPRFFSEAVKAEVFTAKGLQELWDKAPESFTENQDIKKIYLAESKRLRQKTPGSIVPPSVHRKRER